MIISKFVPLKYIAVFEVYESISIEKLNGFKEIEESLKLIECFSNPYISKDFVFLIYTLFQHILKSFDEC